MASTSVYSCEIPFFFFPYGGEELSRVQIEGWEAKKPRQVHQSISLP